MSKIEIPREVIEHGCLSIDVFAETQAKPQVKSVRHACFLAEMLSGVPTPELSTYLTAHPNQNYFYDINISTHHKQNTPHSHVNNLQLSCIYAMRV
jgi:hypothetical protein